MCKRPMPHLAAIPRNAWQHAALTCQQRLAPVFAAAPADRRSLRSSSACCRWENMRFLEEDAIALHAPAGLGRPRRRQALWVAGVPPDERVWPSASPSPVFSLTFHAQVRVTPSAHRQDRRLTRQPAAGWLPHAASPAASCGTAPATPWSPCMARPSRTDKHSRLAMGSTHWLRARQRCSCKHAGPVNITARISQSAEGAHLAPKRVTKVSKRAISACCASAVARSCASRRALCSRNLL